MSCDSQALTMQFSTEFFWENRTAEGVYNEVLTSMKHQSGANSQHDNSYPASQQASKPASQKVCKPASQQASKPESQQVCKPASQQVSKPASQQVSKMQFNSDPHLRRPEEFGVPGMTVMVGSEKLVACTVIGAPSHRSCPFYYKSQVN